MTALEAVDHESGGHWLRRVGPLDGSAGEPVEL